jgi:hypothetical protein
MASPNHTTFPQIELFAEFSPITPAREVWLPVVGFEGMYEVSNRGRVRSCTRTVMFTRVRKEILQQCTVVRRSRMLVCHGQQNTGYLAVNLSREDTVRRCVVHRLVMLAFAGPEPAGHQVNHINGNKQDNRLENLAWVTPAENTRHAFARGLRFTRRGYKVKYRVTPTQVVEIRRLSAEGWSLSMLVTHFNAPISTLNRIVLRKTWKNIP